MHMAGNVDDKTEICAWLIMQRNESVTEVVTEDLEQVHHSWLGMAITDAKDLRFSAIRLRIYK